MKNKIILLFQIFIVVIFANAQSASVGYAGMGRMGMRGASHQVHLTAEWGPKLVDKCYTCHDGRPSRRTVNYNHCVPCHSPDGRFDGMNDPVIGARYNWGRRSSYIYDENGNLRPGKEQWCAGCHDDGTSIIANVRAPNITGRSFTGDWESPVFLVESDITQAENLIDNDPDTGNGKSTGTYMIFDLGSITDISHIRLFLAPDVVTMWAVYGSLDMTNWNRILLGQAVVFATPVWQAGPGEGWNSIRLDKFIPVRYLKLVRMSPGSLAENAIRELEFKQELHYGYYYNGHKISCDNCHNLRANHIDGVARTYQADLDNYNSGYRLLNVELDSMTVPAMEIPRVGCNSNEDLETSTDFALCFKCHDRTKILGDAYSQGSMFQYPLMTNFRNDTHVDENGFVRNEHVTHIRGRGYCGNSPDWDSDWDGLPDSPISCTACHNVHGSPTPAMTRHGELASSPDTFDRIPMINFKYLNNTGQPDPDLTDVMESTGGITQFYAPGPGSVNKNATCAMCHNDSISYRRAPVQLDHSLLSR